MAKERKVIKRKKTVAPKTCFFCTEKSQPNYADISVLQRFVTDRGKIVNRQVNGLCSHHQKQLTLAVKYGRHLALLPFVAHD